LVNLLIMLFAVFLGWVVYLTYNLYLKTKALRRKSSVVLANTIRSSGRLTKKLRFANTTLKGIMIFRQVKKFTELVLTCGLIARKIKL